MSSPPHSPSPNRRGTVVLTAVLSVLAGLAGLALAFAGGVGAQDGTGERVVSLPGFDAEGELIEVVLSSSAAIADVELRGGGPLVVLDGDRPGPSTFSLRDPDLFSAFRAETVEVAIVTRISSESPGVGAPSTAEIDTAFDVEVDVAYGYVALVVDAGISDERSATIAAGSAYELEVNLSNGGNRDLASVVVAESDTFLCEIERLPGGGTDRCVVASTAETSTERTVVVGASLVDEESTTFSASATVAITVAPDQDEVLGVVKSQSDDDAEDEQGESDDGAEDGELAHTGAGTGIFAALGLTLVALGLAARSEGRTIRRRVELR